MQISFLLQKYIFRLFYVVAFLLFLGIFVYAFNREMTRETVGEQAPFVDTLQASNDTLPDDRSLTPDEPHRTPREMARWVSESVPEVLSFDARQYDSQLIANKAYFTDAGFEEFSTYLLQADLKNMLAQSDLKASVIVEQAPLLLNSGAVRGIFRWLYEVPITVSYSPRQQTEITPSTAMPMNRKLMIRLQLGRYDEAIEQDGVKIESWKVSARR